MSLRRLQPGDPGLLEKCDMCTHPEDGQAYAEKHRYIRGQSADFAIVRPLRTLEVVGWLCSFHAREWDHAVPITDLAE